MKACDLFSLFFSTCDKMDLVNGSGSGERNQCRRLFFFDIVDLTGFRFHFDTSRLGTHKRSDRPMLEPRERDPSVERDDEWLRHPT